MKEEEKRKSKIPVGPGADEEGRPTTASEPPVLDPIPSVEPMDPEDELKRPQLSTTLTEEIRLQAEEEKRASVIAENQKGASTRVDAPKVLPASGYTEVDNTMSATPASLDASAVAKRVFSAPIVDSSEEVAVRIPKPDEPISTSTQPSTVSSPNAPASEPAATVPKPAEPLHQRIALPAATTETTVTGPSPAQKQPKGEGKVSSWLKNKLRRSSKPGKPEISKPIPIEDASNEKAFLGGANLTAATSPSDEDGLYAASTQEKGKQRRRSSSPVSSLSSDEGEHPRGRSQLRREVTSTSDEIGGEQEFEEARDHFETEVLAPPAPLKDTVGKSGQSPVRDSIFKEDL